MNFKKKVIAIIPCFKGGDITLRIINECFEYVDQVILIDDQCPFKTGELAIKNIKDERLVVFFNEKNLGVGGSVKKVFKYLLDIDFDVLIKLDADGQMDPKEIPKLINPIFDGYADVTKGNRFFYIDKLSSMPKIRLFGNICLSFLARAATGYWELFDTTNGFIAMNKKTLEKINIEKLDDRFFFETDLLFRLGLIDAIIYQVSTNVIYGNEVSSLDPIKQINNFGIKLFISFFKRIFYQYFLYDFNVGSIELLMTLAFGFLSLVWNLSALIIGINQDKLSSPGTTAFGIILTISTIQFLLAFINYDVTNRVIIKRLNTKRNL